MKFRKLLCVLTSTQNCDEVLSHGVHVAKQYNAELFVLLALEALPPNAKMVMQSASYADSKISIEQHAQDWLNDKIGEWDSHYPMRGMVSMGDHLTSVEHAEKKYHIDLIIKRASDDFLDRIFSSDDMHLLRRCACPVFITHNVSPSEYKNVMIAIDANYHYSDEEAAQRRSLNKRLVSHGMQVAEREKAQCHIVSVFDIYPPALLGDGFISVPQEALEEEAESIRDEQTKIMQGLVDDAHAAISPQLHVIQGNPRSALAEEAKRLDADLVVMGTLARTGFPGLLMGNTAEAVLTQLTCAVLAFKPK